MNDILKTLVETHQSVLLLLAALVFLFIAVVGGVAGKIDPGRTGRIVSGVIGSSLLIFSFVVRSGQSNAVIIYDDSDFRGAREELQLGRYGRVLILNDKVSSLRVPAGMKVTLYDDIDFRGKERTFYKDAEYVGDELNDKTSSIIVEKA